jgi:ribosome-binding factor A
MAMPSKAPSQRQLRVGEAIRHSLADVLMRGELRDPELAGRSITVTEVRVSPDLKNATAFVMPLGGGDSGAVVAALGRAAPFLRAQVAKAIRLRHAPQIRFEIDTSFEHAGRIERLLHDPAVARDLDPTDDRDADRDADPEDDRD